jgi:hypothetical protein
VKSSQKEKVLKLSVVSLNEFLPNSSLPSYTDIFAQSSLSVDHVMVEDPSEEDIRVI